MSESGFDTIIAPATPPVRSALAVIRMDGPGSSTILRGLTGGADLPIERHATLLRLADNGEVLDEAIVLCYRSPRSFTGNDLIEMMVHGNPWIVDRILNAAVRLGARIALPGEFIERAVLAGKLDLVQAEAIGDLISSRTALQAKVSLGNLKGALSGFAEGVRKSLLHVISRLEGALDFAEDGYEFISREAAIAVVKGACEEMSKLIATHARGRAAMEGVTAVLLGRPNAGKSSLLNVLCGTERAIVTEIAGTTRDLLRETVEIGGLPVTLVDTAGLREATEPVERIGVARAREAAQGAGIILYLVDSTLGLQEEDAVEIASLQEPVIVFTKTDLVSEPDGGETAISVRTGAGLPALLKRLDERIRSRFSLDGDVPILVNARQRSAAEETLESLQVSLRALEEKLSDEMVLVDLYRAAKSLGRLTGAISGGDIRAEIFSKFCIGK